MPVPPLAVLLLAVPVLFDAQVRPVLAAKCRGCHNPALPEGRLDLSGVPALLRGGKHGPAVVPGNAADSLMLLRAGGHQLPAMPPKGNAPLTPDEFALLERWVNQGARERRGSSPPSSLPPPLLPATDPSQRLVRAVAVHPVSGLVAAGRGNQVPLFDGKTGAPVRSLRDPDLRTPDGKPVPAAHLGAVEAMAFRPDGSALATGSFGGVTVWNPDTGAVVRRIGGFTGRVLAVAYSADGTLLAAAGGPPGGPGECKVFAAATGAPVADLAGHPDTVYGVAFRPDGRFLATAGADRGVRVYQLPGGGVEEWRSGGVKKDGGLNCSTPPLLHSSTLLEGHTGYVLDVAWVADGKHLVSAGADGTLKVWDTATGEKSRDVPAGDQAVNRLAVAGRAGKVFTAGGDRSVRQFRADTFAPERQYVDNKEGVDAVACSPDGAVVAAGGAEGVVRIYNGATGQLVKAATPAE